MCLTLVLGSLTQSSIRTVLPSPLLSCCAGLSTLEQNHLLIASELALRSWFTEPTTIDSEGNPPQSFTAFPHPSFNPFPWEGLI